MMDKAAARCKKESLLNGLRKLNSLMVAFSGGVDSAFLLAAAREALGKKAAAATAVSPIHPRREREEAVGFARDRGIAHFLFGTNEMEIPEFIANDIDRCYHCKRALCGKLLRLARDKGMGPVAHGANVDDLEDYRPGFRAAKEAGIMAPLIDADLSKEEIRFLAKEMGLFEWDKPSMACLASRFPYGCPISEQGLGMVEAAEAFLWAEGFKCIRVRHHGPVARVEVDASEIHKIVSRDTRKAIVERFQRIGFDHVALDLEGYVSGKMNRGIEELRT